MINPTVHMLTFAQWSRDCRMLWFTLKLLRNSYYERKDAIEYLNHGSLGSFVFFNAILGHFYVSLMFFFSFFLSLFCASTFFSIPFIYFHLLDISMRFSLQTAKMAIWSKVFCDWSSNEWNWCNESIARSMRS